MGEKPQFMTFRDIPLALGLLTRLPVTVDPEVARRRGAAAAWAYPLAGLVVAVCAAALGWAALAVGLPGALAAGLVLATQTILTGALHEDGLADTADGLWGGWDRDRRLEIMKDSRIGTYGVIALVLSFGLRWSALAALAPVMGPALLAAALLSRAGMTAVMGCLPPARDGGLSRGVGCPATRAWGAACAIAVGLSFAVAGPVALGMALAAGFTALACAAIARSRIGGQTGDILGATQQVAEIACLAVAAALVG
jgi:adenosylcobinamide-GDP ribazoletransferase